MGRERGAQVFCDFTTKKLGAAVDSINSPKGQIEYFYHLAAFYDLGADEASQIAMNTSFKMLEGSGAAKVVKPGDKLLKQQLSSEAITMQQMMRGIHF